MLTVFRVSLCELSLHSRSNDNNNNDDDNSENNIDNNDENDDNNNLNLRKIIVSTTSCTVAITTTQTMLVTLWIQEEHFITVRLITIHSIINRILKRKILISVIKMAVFLFFGQSFNRRSILNEPHNCYLRQKTL